MEIAGRRRVCGVFRLDADNADQIESRFLHVYCTEGSTGDGRGNGIRVAGVGVEGEGWRALIATLCVGAPRRRKRWDARVAGTPRSENLARWNCTDLCHVAVEAETMEN